MTDPLVVLLGKDIAGLIHRLNFQSNMNLVNRDYQDAFVVVENDPVNGFHLTRRGYELLVYNWRDRHNHYNGDSMQPQQGEAKQTHLRLAFTLPGNYWDVKELY